MEHVGNPINIELKKGDLLFVPGGCPHAVRNLTHVVAMAGNFVCKSNLKSVLGDLEHTQHRYADDKALFMALDEIDFDGSEEEEEAIAVDRPFELYMDFYDI